MKAALLMADARIEIAEMALAPLAADECTVRIGAAGVCSSDVARAFAGGAYFYPLVMGHELAGEVVACGDSVPVDLGPGQAVTVFPLLPCFTCEACALGRYAQCRSYDYYGSRRHGGFAEFLNVKAWNLLPLPDGVGIVDGALTEPVSVVVHALDRLGVLIAPTGPLLVLGAGFLGLLAVKVLRQCRPDLAVTVVDRNPAKLALAAADGAATEVLGDEAEWQAFVESNRATFPAVLEAAGVPATFRHALDLCRHGGRVVWMGNVSGDVSLPQALVSQVLRKEIDILGTWNSSYRGRAESDWTRALALMAQGLAPSGLVDVVVGLEELAPLLADLDAHKRRRIHRPRLKAMVRPHG